MLLLHIFPSPYVFLSLLGASPSCVTSQSWFYPSGSLSNRPVGPGFCGSHAYWSLKRTSEAMKALVFSEQVGLTAQSLFQPCHSPSNRWLDPVFAVQLRVAHLIHGFFTLNGLIETVFYAPFIPIYFSWTPQSPNRLQLVSQ